MSAFTCITCRVAFSDADIQRAHYKTDWHRYNLKRKVAELPAVTAENFQQRVLAQRAQVVEKQKNTPKQCQLCKKHFSTENAFQNHLQSKKHKEAELKEEQKQQAQIEKRNEKNEGKGIDVLEENVKVTKKESANQALKQSLTKKQAQQDAAGITKDGDVEMDSDAESCESWEGEALGIEECLFCSHISQSLEKNVDHMTKSHSFFIPDCEYLMDLEGLITYLGEKVGDGHVCLWCNERGRGFYTTQAVQQHMLDKGHCKMLHEGDVLVEYADYYDYSKSYPDSQAEGASSGDVEMQDSEQEVAADVLIEENYQLMLPSGASIGHRSLQKYFKQNLPHRRESNSALVHKMLAQYKALGWTGVKGTVAQRKRAKDIGYIQRLKSRHHTKLSVKANKFQPHYRDDNFG